MIVLSVSPHLEPHRIYCALSKANELDLQTIILTGNNSLDPHLFEKLNCAIKVPSTITASIQEIHIQAGHYICGFVEDEIFGK